MNDNFILAFATSKFLEPLRIVKSVNLRADLPHLLKIHHIVPSLWFLNQRGVNTKYVKKGGKVRQKLIKDALAIKPPCIFKVITKFMYQLLLNIYKKLKEGDNNV
ncbi:MAG: hypothetical protein N2201_00020 [candidate division WOR-3 bacterium]|nr:hypothetical protein [candidate division WOR-3 bacterium]